MSESVRASGVRGTWAGARRQRELTTGVSLNRTYTYDEVGNRLTRSDSGALCTYGYDPSSVLRYGTDSRYRATRPVAEKARADGYDIIRYRSERGPGCSYAVIDHFDELLEPLDLAGVGPQG